MSPTVSVIIPTHNRADFLPRAIGSVLSQTYEDYELIVVDDYSTDGTKESLLHWADNRVRYIRHESNRGQSAAVNTGINSAQGEYVAFLDDDDEWLPTKLERQLETFDASGPSVGLVYTWFDGVDEMSGRIHPSYRNTMSGDISDDLLGLKIPCATSGLIARRRTARDVGGFDESMSAFNDLDFLIRVALNYQIEVAPEVLVLAHKGHGQGQMDVDSRKVLTAKVDYIRAHMRRHSTRLSESRTALARVHLHLGRNELFLGNRRAGLTAIMMSVRLDPFRIIRLMATRGLRELKGIIGSQKRGDA